MAQKRDLAMSLTTSSTEFDRVERLFTKAMWMVGVMGFIAFGSGAVTYLTAYSQISQTAEGAEKRIRDVSQSAETEIKSQVSKASEAVVTEIRKNFDVNRLETRIIEEELPRIHKDVAIHVERTSYDLSGRLEQIRSESERLKSLVHEKDIAIKDLQERLEKMVTKVELIDNLDFSISSISISPYSPKIGTPAQLTAQIKAENPPYVLTSGSGEREGKFIVDVSINMKAFDQTWATEAKLTATRTGGETIDVAIPIMIPHQSPSGDLKYGPGKYNIEVVVYSKDKANMLAASSKFIDLRE
jgi:hypothetical protein